MRKILCCLALCGLSAFAAFAQDATKKTRLLICGDDGGAALSFNEGTIEAFKNGLMRCANVIVPGPWFLDMARRANENPGLAVGVHLDLTAEWDGVKWRPVTGLRSLTDADGYLPATNRGFLELKAPLADVERELRAQIEMAKKHIRNVGWLWAHMGTATATPELKALTLRLAKEYDLPLLGSEGSLRIFRVPKGESFVRAVENLPPGNWFFIEHPSIDTPESRAIGHPGNTDVAEARARVVKMWTDPELRRVVETKGIELLNLKETVKLLRNR